MRQTYFCPNCRALIARGDGFCGNCGSCLKWMVLQMQSRAFSQDNANQSQHENILRERGVTMGKASPLGVGAGASIKTEVAELLADFFSKQVKRN